MTTAPPIAEPSIPYVSKQAEAMAPLAGAAVAAIRRAVAQQRLNGAGPSARSIWQPDTWLIQQIWQTLAQAGETEAALAVARRAATRDPLAPVQVLYRLAMDGEDDAQLREWLQRELGVVQSALFRPAGALDAPRQSEGLLLAAAAALHTDDSALSLTFLERLDQLDKGWDHIFANPELRRTLATATAHIGLHPLTTNLIRTSIRRFGEAGADFLKQVAQVLGPQLQQGDVPRRVERLLMRCVETVRYATLVTMHSHRVATAIFARAGLADEVLAHLATIARIQEARRESGLSLRKNDQSLLRQVKRPQADADVDFLVYTLQEAIRALPVRQITREQRIELSQQLAALGMRSDGWTAAAAAGTLIDLGALKFAVDVVDQIAVSDPTRSEGAIALVDGLLRTGEPERAAEESEKALAWARAREGNNAVRATVWGLAEVYLAHGQPEQALALLAARQLEPGFFERLRGLFQPQWNDDALRDNRLRLAARLQQDADSPEVDALVRDLRQWAPRLLDGEALNNFYADGMVEPLLLAGRTDLVATLLPEIGRALAAGGSKHASHVARLAGLMAQIIRSAPDAEEAGAATAFLENLWSVDAQKGLWQTVYGVEGSLPLLLALEGPAALEGIAQAAEAEGANWSLQE